LPRLRQRPPSGLGDPHPLATSIALLPAVALASPAAHRSTDCATVKPCASMIASVQPSMDASIRGLDGAVAYWSAFEPLGRGLCLRNRDVIGQPHCSRSLLSISARLSRQNAMPTLAPLRQLPFR